MFKWGGNSGQTPVITCGLCTKLSKYRVPLHLLLFSGQTSVGSESSLSRPWVSLVAQMVKNLPEKAGDSGSISGSGRLPWRRARILAWRTPREWRGAWWATVQGVAESHNRVTNTHTEPVLGLEGALGASSMSRILAFGNVLLLLFWNICLFLAVWGLSCGLQTLPCCVIVVGSLLSCSGLSYSDSCGILVPPLGVEPVFPVMEGGFLTTGPPAKSLEMCCWRDNGTAFQSLENRKESIRLPVEQLRMSCLKYQPDGRPDSEFLVPYWECRPQKPASGFESWSFPNILVLKIFFATNKTMFRTNINALKPTMVLWSPVNRSRFLKTDVFVVWCWCGWGSSYSDGWQVSSSPNKGMKWWLFTQENQNPTTVILASSNHWKYFGGVLLDLLEAHLIHQVQYFKKNLT